MQADSSLPAGIPRWAARRPHIAAAALRWRNAYRHDGARLLLVVLLTLLAACGLAEIPAAGLILDWLGRNVIVTVLVATCLFALSTSRRKERAAAEAARSWLTPLPCVSPVSLTVMWGTTVRLLLVLSFAALVWLLGQVAPAAVWRLAVTFIGGAVLGSLAGRQLRRGSEDTPGFHYATVRRARARWATRPSLLPLAYWPAAQGRIFSRPKVLSRVAFTALLTLPMGTPGQVALAIAAASIALVSVASLSLAAVRVAFEAAPWLAPTTLRRARFTRAMLWRVIMTQALALAVMVFLACAIDLPKALRLGVALAVGSLIVSLAVAAVACAWACRRAGLGAELRGASSEQRLAA
ncbi:MAG TPA: hypothetical protein VFX20_12260 [Steroidobacteraceae bacterium]|nr:hypothetical protein [Steroidobacteraceae bacterium]